MTPHATCDQMTPLSLLEMELEVLGEEEHHKQTANVVEEKAQVKKTVRFEPCVRQKTIPTDDVPGHVLWYEVGQLMNDARADVKRISWNLREGKMSKKDVHFGVDGLCGRGLEAYIEQGELSRRQGRRKAYIAALIRKRESQLTLSSDMDEVADRLEKFLTDRSKACRELAQTMGVQDSTDARTIYETLDLTECLSNNDAPSAGAPSSCPIMAKQQKQLINSMTRSHHTANHPSVLAAKETRTL